MSTITGPRAGITIMGMTMTMITPRGTDTLTAAHIPTRTAMLMVTRTSTR